MMIKPIVELMHDYLKESIKAGDIVVDCTAGNGNDTLLLSELVGDEGKVYAFDIQKMAIENTAALLGDHNLEDRVTLLQKNYREIKQFVPQEISIVVFNLGYLPKGDHTVVSDPADTVKAIADSMALLKQGGRLFVAVYWGHPNGECEKNCIEELLKQPIYKSWGMYCISVPNREKAPYLLIMEKTQVE